MVVHQLISSSSHQSSGSRQQNLGIGFTQNPNSQNYLSLLVIPEDATTNNSEFNPSQTTLTNNIPPVTVTENKSLAAIFPFKLEETINLPLFSGAALKEKPITVMYTDAKVDGHSIKLILDINCTVSTRIITANGVTKTPIGEIDDFSIEVNDIIVPIKVLIMKATQYQALNTQELQLSQNGQHTWEAYQVSWADINHNELLPILAWNKNDNKKKKQREKPTWKATIDAWTDNNQSEMPPILDWEEKNKKKGKGREENIPKETTTVEEITSGWEREYSCEPIKKPPYIPFKCKDYSYPHDKNKIWQMANTKVEGALPNEILEIKNNPPEPTDIVLVLNPDNLAPTREKQEQRLEEINTQLCDHCLIPYDFQFCNDCDLIYNLPPCMIYTIPKEKKPINNCTSKSESSSNPDSNSNNNDNKNNGSSSIQNGYNNDNDSNSDSNSDLNYEQYIAFSDFTKKQELKWFSDNNKGIMSERAHDTDARFDLRYPGKDAIKLEPHLCTCIDLKIVLEIPATTMVQLASRSSLAKKGINIRGRIIDAEYVENIITMLQNDSEKVYVIEPNERIAQAIFLSLVKIAQLVSVRNRKKLGITARGIQRFESMGRIDVPVNMVEKKIIGQGEIISTTIERREKEQKQIFEAKATLCESEEIGFINLHIPAKSHNHIKIPIYNNTRNVVEILEGTTLEYLTTEIEDQAPSSISNFSQLCGYVDITSQTIYGVTSRILAIN
ncbi:hypothetical protein G9A89_020684 [Geosiphon pyriformis]|nr:hypothetical protein G9A89_020684 [Geosiphon pyriformis]